MKWYPTNGSDGMMLDCYCADCTHYDDCQIIAKSLLARGKEEMPDEWTSDDIYGRGFACSAKEKCDG